MRLARVIPAALALVALASLTVVTAGCYGNTSGPTDFAPYQQIDLKIGSGTAAESGKSVTVNYTGWLYDPAKTEQKGLVFDTSSGRGAFTFVVGAGSVIEGWDKGVLGMKVGGFRRLVVPPSMAYGQTRYSVIPPNATLVFEIELVDVQ